MEDRIPYLKNSCMNDPELFEEVKSLLDQEDSDWLEEPLVQMQSSYIFSKSDSVIDHTIGPYRLIRPIAAGGMGQVYLAVRNDQQFERFVAIKVIKKGVVSDEVLYRFYEERQILATLNHPYIARLFDGGTTQEGLPWFAMEYVEGVPITEYCDKHDISTENRLRLFLKVCDAIQYAHQNLVVHQDLKPVNILITDNGQPKLLDFGIAKLLGLEKDKGVNQISAQVMTPEYASPEQITNVSISTASDIYSLGVLLYELLAGRRPYLFEERVPDVIRQTICNQIPEPPSAIPGSKLAKSDLDDIILKALKKEPTERYRSVEQFAGDIRRYQKSLPVIARKDSFSYRSKKFLNRNRWSISVSAAIAVVILVFSGITYFQSVAIEQRALEVETQRDRAEQVSEFLINLFGSVDPSEALDKSLPAVELLHRGADRIETELSEQPDLQAELYLVISEVYEQLGLFDEGIDLAQKAYQIQSDIYDSPHPDIASSLNALGWLFRQKGEFQTAESYLQSVLDMRIDLFGHTHPEVARTLNDMAVLKQSQGDYAATDSLLLRALEIRRGQLGDQHESVGVTLSNYAALKWRLGDLEAAEEMMREALSVFQHN